MSSTFSDDFDWNEAFSAENKARTIQYCKEDRESSCYTFPTDDSTFRRAAVLVPLCYDVLGRPSILYNLRSLTLSRDKGEISFPGGMMEQGDDNSPIVTALRETEEELGLKRDKVDVWVVMRNFKTYSPSLGVTAVIGFIRSPEKLDPSKMNINPGEVDHAFTVTLEHLCDSRNWDEVDRMNRTFPAYKNLNVHNDIGTVDLWGLTAEITDLALKALLPTAYKRNFSFVDQ